MSCTLHQKRFVAVVEAFCKVSRMKFASATKLDRQIRGTWGTRPVLLLVKSCDNTVSEGAASGSLSKAGCGAPDLSHWTIKNQPRE